MSSHSGCGHDHHSAAGMTEGRVKLSLFITFAFVAGEFIAGVRSNSLALLSDSGHNFSDGLALLVSWWALRVARRPANSVHTYGYHRAGILAALFNAVTLGIIATMIFIEGFRLLLHPEAVQSAVMIWVAAIAFVMNTFIAMALRGEAHHDVNVRSAYIHMVGDALSSIGVVIAGVVIHFTGWQMADPVVSLLIGAFIIYSSAGIIKETINVLLEAAPAGLDVTGLIAEMRGQVGVADVHDLHVWSIANGMNALSCHLIIDDANSSRATEIVADVKRLLAKRQIPHSTIETECGGCTNPETFCQLENPRGHVHDHDHEHDHAGPCQQA